MEQLEKFLMKNSLDGGFLQSEEWEKFQKKMNKKIYSFFDKKKIRCLGVFNKIPVIGSYLFIPRGPVIKFPISNFQFLKKSLNEMVSVARDNNVGWIRIEPQSFEVLASIKKNLGREYKIKKTRKDHEPAQTLFLDLRKNEEDILMNMKSKTRYNIRLCNKNKVKIIKSQSRDDFEDFFCLIEETAQRNRVQFYPKDYYIKMIKTINKKNLKLYLARFNGDTIASILVSFYGGVATYLHGASSDKYRNKMAVYGLQWTAIKEAKAAGCIKYDLGGISESTNKYPQKKEKWSGITRFKRGFLPKEKIIEFPGCWDIILNKKKYFLYKFIQKIKDLKKAS